MACIDLPVGWKCNNCSKGYFSEIVEGEDLKSAQKKKQVSYTLLAQKCTLSSTIRNRFVVILMNVRSHLVTVMQIAPIHL